ncbi:MAG: hypothetical protein HZB16_06590, partial [Armatimonadetes bacterium]|nr:hypothetical protein [Armatimonadota bacterium]
IIDVGGTVSMDLRRVGSELRGTIRNAMPYALRGAVLCWRDRIRPLGTIAPSEQVDIANAWGPWAATPGCAQVLAAMGRGNVPTNVRELVARYPRPEPGGTVRRGESPDSPPTRATLLAWVEAPWMPVEVSPKVGSQQRAQVLQVVGTVALASSDERRYTLEACRARRIEGGPAPATIAVYASRGQLPKSVSRLGVSGRTGNLALWNHRRSAWQRLSAGGSASLPAADYLRGGRVLLRDDQVATDGGRDPDAETYAQLTAPPKDVTITAIVEDRHGQR